MEARSKVAQRAPAQATGHRVTPRQRTGGHGARSAGPQQLENDQQAAYQPSGNGINGQATPLSFAASRDRAFGEGSAKGTFADAAPLSSQSRNALPSGVICQPELSRKINL